MEIKIIYTSKELSAREKVKFVTGVNAAKLDDLTQESTLVIGYAYHVILHVDNPDSESKEYDRLIIADRDGNYYSTGSQTVRDNLNAIVNTLAAEGVTEDIDLEFFRAPSKKHAGKEFMSVQLI